MHVIRTTTLNRRRLQVLQVWTQATTLITGLVLPVLLLSSTASAAPLTSRSVTISTSVASSSSVTYTYGFTLPTSGSVQSIGFQACTTPLGTCTSPGGTVSMNAGTEASRSGWTDATAFTRDAVGAGGCTAAANMLCVKRTAATAESGAKTLGWNTQTNPTALASYFVRIITYSDAAWATPVDSGVVAYAIISQLTVNARIQEILNFCVGTTAVNDATTDPTSGPNNDCASISGTTVDIGVLDPSAINLSPVSTNGGSNTNGIALVRTNAQNGVVITYFTEQDTSSGTLKVTGAACGSITPGSGSTTDQCINSSGTQATFTAGVENFGMTVAGTNCGSTTSYTCAYASGTNNLEPTGQYIGAAANAYGTTNGYAWNSTTTPATIATSAGSTVKVVDDEALILRFASTPQITTPTGAYTTTSTYIATATY